MYCELQSQFYAFFCKKKCIDNVFILKSANCNSYIKKSKFRPVYTLFNFYDGIENQK